MMRLSFALLTLGLLLAFNASSRADNITYLGVGLIPGDARDLSGLEDKTSDGTPQNRLGGLGSGIAYTGKGNEFVLISDRGPKDGASDFICRYHRMDIRVTPGKKKPVQLKLTATRLLTNEAGKHFVGSQEAFEHKKPEKNLRFDGEAIRVGRDGTLFIADEYGPVLAQFNEKGQRLRSLPIPEHFCPIKPGKTPADEMPPKSMIGRQSNRGMEGLAISPDGSRLYGIMQSPLIQDNALDDENLRVGINCRILEIEISSGKTREFVYQLEQPSLGLCEILAVNDHEFLVLERDGKGGEEAACKKIFHIDLTGATDVSRTDSLPKDTLPTSITPVKKKLFIDLLETSFNIAGKDCPEKFEGLAFGPNLPDGRLLLIVTADNDFIAEKPLSIYAFAIDKAALPNYKPQQFNK